MRRFRILFLFAVYFINCRFAAAKEPSTAELRLLLLHSIDAHFEDPNEDEDEDNNHFLRFEFNRADGGDFKNSFTEGGKIIMTYREDCGCGHSRNDKPISLSLLRTDKIREFETPSDETLFRPLKYTFRGTDRGETIIVSIFTEMTHDGKTRLAVDQYREEMIFETWNDRVDYLSKEEWELEQGPVPELKLVKAAMQNGYHLKLLKAKPVASVPIQDSATRSELNALRQDLEEALNAIGALKDMISRLETPQKPSDALIPRPSINQPQDMSHIQILMALPVILDIALNGGHESSSKGVPLQDLLGKFSPDQLQKLEYLIAKTRIVGAIEQLPGESRSLLDWQGVSDPKLNSIVEAHYAGACQNSPNGIHVLQQAGFSEGQISVLVQNGICGNNEVPDPNKFLRDKNPLVAVVRFVGQFKGEKRADGTYHIVGLGGRLDQQVEQNPDGTWRQVGALQTDLPPCASLLAQGIHEITTRRHTR